jgi:hypothetical protein
MLAILTEVGFNVSHTNWSRNVKFREILNREKKWENLEINGKKQNILSSAIKKLILPKELKRNVLKKL